MRFIVGTHSYLLLVTVDDELTITDTQVLDTGYFDGCDVMADGTIVACHKMEPWSKRSPTGFHFYNSEGPIIVPPINGDDILDPHQLTLDADQRGCWNTSTATDELVYKSLRDSERDWRCRFHPGDADYHHLNSVYVEPDHVNVIYIVFHNLSRAPSEVKRFHVKRYVIDQGEERLELLDTQEVPHLSIHNFYIEDGTFYYNASDDAAVVRGKWGPENWYRYAELEKKWHPKGMAVTADYCVSGYSEHAVSTPRRFVSESGLVFVDRESWQIQRLSPILLPNGDFAGNVNECRVYPESGF